LKKGYLNQKILRKAFKNYYFKENQITDPDWLLEEGLR
jgi:hypothetical protein